MASFKDFLDNFTTSEDLEHWATNSGLLNIPDVKERIENLKLIEILGIQDFQPSQSSVNDVINEIENSLTAPNLTVMTHDEIQHVLQDLDKTPGKRGDNQGSEGPNKRPRLDNTQPYFVEVEDNNYDIRSWSSRSFKGHVLQETTYSVHFNNAWHGKLIKDLQTDLKKMFGQIISQGDENYSSDDIARMYITHKDLRKPIIVTPRPLKDLTPEAIMETVSHTLQSAEGLAVSESFEVQLGIAKLKSGGSNAKHITNIQEHRITKKSLVCINNTDKLCMGRAIAVGFARLEMDENKGDREKSKTYGKIRKGDQGWKMSLQKKKAQEYHNSLGLPLDKECTLADLPKFEKLLKIDIIVFAASLFNRVIYPSKDRVSSTRRIYLYYTEPHGEGHFDTITNIRGLLATRYFCHKCLVGYNNHASHICAIKCLVCKSPNCVEINPQSCRYCKVTCRSTECFIRHKKVTQKSPISECEKWWRCPKCKRGMKRKERSMNDHVCGEYKCTCCNEYYIDNHNCYLRIKQAKEPNCKFIFLDFECTMETKTHIPNYALAQTECFDCEDKPLKDFPKCNSCGNRCTNCNRKDGKTKKYTHSPCVGCGFREVIFKGADTKNDVGKWLFHENHKDFTVFCHNGKGYDNYFLMSYLIENTVAPDLIFSGSKIQFMHVKKGLNIKVLDSLNFLSMPLAALPKAFDLKESKKGHFPYFFNKPSNEHYIGSYPPMTDYNPDSMGVKQRLEFIKWYDEHKHGVFNMQKELMEYTRSDVEILRKAIMKFRKLMLETTGDIEQVIDGETFEVKTSFTGGIDPCSYVTIASMCMGIYRYLFHTEKWKVVQRNEKEKAILENREPEWLPAIKKDKNKLFYSINAKWYSATSDIVQTKFISSPLAFIPPGGYTSRDNFSKISIQWLKYEEWKRGVTIQHALNMGEKRVPTGKGRFYKLDGYYLDPKTSQPIALEFNGCMHHGCPSCYVDGESIDHPTLKYPLSIRYRLTQEKKKRLEALGFKVITMWEHQFKEELQRNVELKKFVEDLDIRDRLQMRDSFFGGRTNAIKLHYKARDNEVIKYYDYTSLYPYVLKYCKFPLGHPEIIVKDFKSLDQYFGLVKADVLGPKQLFHPLLPVRCNGKLLFPLCMSCTEREQQTPCQCNEKSRTLSGTWTIIEVLKAIDMGYKISKIHEVYHWSETTQYNTEEGTGGLFAGYVNKFLRLKQQASGWPDWCKNQDDRERYVTEYRVKEGISLDPDKIEVNPGLRSLAKLCLNSFWGKFAQRTNMTRSAMISDEAEFYRKLTDPSKQLEDWHILTDDLVRLDFKCMSEFEEADMITNIVIATFTTAHARLKLYELLERLNQNVLYFDTDSVFFKWRPLEYIPPLGDYLGALTDEAKGHDIVEFVSTGPKSYAYMLDNGEHFCKVKGFTLNFQNSNKLNFQTMKNEVFTWQNDVESGEINLINPHKICRDARQFRIYNREEPKKFQITYNKRVVQPDLSTLPFGF